jgi:enamine deaminase RidA (YjgF/YER057c/UK114 family)
MRILQPPDWKPPKGFSNGVSSEGRLIFVAGQVGADAAGRIVSGGFADQAAQALRNILSVLEEDGAAPAHLTRLTWYVTDMDEYLAALKELGREYRAIIGEHYPAMALVGVTALVTPGAKVEIEATAVVPNSLRWS